IIGYRGMIDLARRSGQIISLSARAVYENDEFSYEYGLHEDLKHKPYEDGDSGALTHVYAVAKLKDGGVQF
ncbi:recombinase RecT, partial [Kingella kingae]